jgi:hypothetical protein
MASKRTNHKRIRIKVKLLKWPQRKSIYVNNNFLGWRTGKSRKKNREEKIAKLQHEYKFY